MNDKKPNVLIIGGGIAGMLLAIALTKKQVPYTLFESESQFVTQGAGIGIGKNSLKAMGLIDERYLEKYLQIATGNKSPDKSHVMFEVMPATDERSFEPFEVSSGSNPRTSAHRRQLLQIGQDLLPENVVRFGKRAIGVEMEGDEKVAVFFEDGQKAVGDLVIACDGGKGPFREYVVGEDFKDAEFSGTYVYRSVMPMDQAKTILGEGAMDSKMFLDKNRHLMTYPISGGSQLNIIAFKRAERWMHGSWQKSVSPEDMIKDFEGFREPLIKLISSIKPVQWALFHNWDTPCFHKDLVVLAGDSAHLSTPHQAAGAGQGIEDVYMLSCLLDRADSHSKMKDALRAYNHFRRPRTLEVVRTSYKAGTIYDLCDAGFEDNMKMIESDLGERFKWIWDHDLQGEVDAGLKMLDEPLDSML